MGTLSLRLIDIFDYKETAIELLNEHYEELATNKDLMKLDPDWVAYSVCDLLSIGLFDGDKLVGYSVNIMQRNLHYKSLFMCQNDLLFVSKPYRNSIGLRLISETEQCAKDLDCHLMLWHAKQNTSLDLIMRRKKYKVQDIIYSKGLI